MNLLLIQKARQNYLLYASLLFSVLFLVCGVLFPDALVSGLNKTNAQLLAVFTNYYLWVGLLVVLTALVVLFLPISKKRLGTAEPEYSWFSWIALLYSTGMGSGLLLRAVQEPVYYLHNPPVNGMDAKQMALQYTFFHWGVTPWAMYSVFGLIVAYNLYLRKAPNFLQAIVVDDKAKFVQKTVPFFIVIITIAGVIASLGLGTGQFIGGLNQYFSLDLGNSFLLLTVFGIGLTGTLSALTGINKVIKYLADFDMTVSIMLMIFIALFLNFSNFFSNTGAALLNYIRHFFEMSLSAGSYKTDGAFTRDWTVFYWAFWLSWVPFTGIFIARISKGRTIRSFIVATILVPSLATALWFSVFANQAFDLVEKSDPQQFNNLFTSLFVFLQHFPFSNITVLVAATLVLVAIINSVDSAIFVLGMFSDKGNENPVKKHKLLWGIIITATAFGLTAVGKNDLLNAISSLLIILALPFSVLYLYVIVSFLTACKKFIR